MMMPSVNNDPVSLLQQVGTNPAALAHLVENEQPALRLWLMRIVRDSDLVDEALQETWLTLSQGEWRFAARSDDANGDARAWLRQIVLRSALRLRKKQSTHQRHIVRWWSLTPKPSEQPTPLEHIAEQDRRDLVWSLIAELPPTMRDVIELHFRDGLNFSQVGKAQGCSALTARVRTWRAVQQLRKHFLLLGILALPGPLLGIVSMNNSGSTTTSISLFTHFWPSIQRAIFHLTPQQLTVTFLALTTAVSTIVISGLFIFKNANDVPVAAHHTEKHLDDSLNSQENSNAEMVAAMLINKNNKDALGLSSSNSNDPRQGQFDIDISEPPLRQILFECKIFIFPELGQKHSVTAPTIITQDQLAGIKQLLTDAGAEILASPMVTNESGKTCNIQLINQYAYIKGYNDLDEENISKGIIDPFIDVLNTGFETSLAGKIDGSDIILTQAHTKKSELLKVNEKRSALKHVDINALKTYPWEEPQVSLSQSIPLPKDGLRVPLGHSVLVPVESGVIQNGSPQGVSTTPDSQLKRWWLLVTPSQIHEEAPTTPKAST